MQFWIFVVLSIVFFIGGASLLQAIVVAAGIVTLVKWILIALWAAYVYLLIRLAKT